MLMLRETEKEKEKDKKKRGTKRNRENKRAVGISEFPLAAYTRALDWTKVSFRPLFSRLGYDSSVNGLLDHYELFKPL